MIINALDYVFISECKNYKSLTDSTRKLNVPSAYNNKRADRLGLTYTSVDWQGEGWYRVHSYAGTRILENPFTIAQVQSGMYVCIYLFSSIQMIKIISVLDNVCKHQIHFKNFSHYIMWRVCGLVSHKKVLIST